jgi:hypothetical protein
MSDGRITDKAPYGRHVTLVCADHPDLQWSTKNIGSVFDGQVSFCRSLFFESFGPECSCNQSRLRLHPSYATADSVEA